MIQLKDVIHFYIGCRVTIDDKEEGILKGGTFVPNSVNQVYYDIQTDEMLGNEGEDFYMPYNDDFDLPPMRIKPHLRKLSNMNEEEERKARFIIWNETSYKHVMNPKAFVERNEFSPKLFQFLLSKRFDLFNLIENGFAIESTK